MSLRPSERFYQSREKPLAVKNDDHAETGDTEQFSVSTGTGLKLSLTHGSVRCQTPTHPTPAALSEVEQ